MKLSKFILIFLLFINISCSKGLPFNIFDPETFIGFLISLDPYSYNPPANPDLNVSGMVSSIQEGQTFTVNVSLTNPPISTQEVVISTSSTALLVNGAESITLSFDSSNYSTSQSITFSTVVDSNSNNESVTVIYSLTNLSESQYSVSILDDTAISITGVPSTLLEGTTATLNVNFSKTLLSDNTITVTSSNSAAISFNGSATTTLNYTTANGTSPQAITILAEEDTNLANETVTLTFTANGVASSTVTIRTTDNDGQNIVLSNGADFLREGGATGTIDVHLSFDPGADAVVTVTSGNSNSLSVSPSTLTFNSSNYTTDQQVTLTALDEVNQTSEDVSVLFTTNGATPQIHPLKTIDDDIQVVIAGANTVNEGGQSTVIISLSGDPGETRVINLTSSDTNAVTLSTNSLTFTSDNYSQSILIFGVEDTNVASESVTITATPAVAGGIVGATQNITTVDNDSMNIVLSGLGSTMVNEGLTTTFRANLTHDPGGDLIVNFSSSYSGVTVTPSSFTFNSSNYNSQQTITINALQDANQESETVTITASATGVTTSPTIQVTTIEDDTVPVITGDATVAEGGFTVLNLKLSGNPGNNRTVTVDLIGTTSSVSLSSNTFNFTPNNYDAVQTFIITGLQDTNVANESFTVRATFDSINYISHAMSTADEDSLELVITDEFGNTIPNGSVLNVNEGSNIKFNVKLNFEPESPVTINYSSTPTALGINLLSYSSALTINNGCTGTSNCWDTNQLVTVNAVENDYIDDKLTTLTFTASGGLTATKSFSLKVIDNDPIVQKNIVTGGLGTGFRPNPILFGGKLHIVSRISFGSNDSVGVRFSCNYDGSNCLGTVARYESDGSNSGWDPSVVVANPVPVGNPAASSDHLVAVYEDRSSGLNHLILRRNYDNALYNWWYPADLSVVAGSGDNSGYNPYAVTYENQLIIKSHGGNRLILYNCAMDGSTCSHTILKPSGTVPDWTSPKNQSLIVDPIRKILTVIYRSPAGSFLGVQCPLPLSSPPTCGTEFNFHNISTPTPPGDVSWNANGVLDTISSPNKLIIIGNASNRYPVVFVCDLNMTSCNSNSINLTNQFLNDNSTSVIDPINRKLFMFGYNIDLDSALFLHRCNLDGTSCTTRNLSVLAKTNATGDTPVGVLDLPNKKIYVVSENKAFGSVPSYWSIPLYIEDP